MIKSEQFIDKILAVIKKADLPTDIFENLEEAPASSDPNPLLDIIEEETDKEQDELEAFLSQLSMEEDEEEVNSELAEELEPELKEPVLRPLSEELEPEIEYPVENLSSFLSESSYINKLEKLAIKLDVSGGGRWSPSVFDDDSLKASPEEEEEEIDWEKLLKTDDSDSELENLREYIPEDAPSTEVDLSDLESPESSSIDVDLSELETPSVPEWEEEVNVDELNCLCSELFGKKKF